MAYNCAKCKEKDNDRMVACDTCDSWFHFTCVGVDQSISEQPWSCVFCEQNTSAVGSPSFPGATSANETATPRQQQVSYASPNTRNANPCTTPTIFTPSAALNVSYASPTPASANPCTTPTFPTTNAALNVPYASHTLASAKTYTAPAIIQANQAQQNAISMSLNTLNHDLLLQTQQQISMLEEQHKVSVSLLHEKIRLLSVNPSLSDHITQSDHNINNPITTHVNTHHINNPITTHVNAHHMNNINPSAVSTHFATLYPHVCATPATSHIAQTQPTFYPHVCGMPATSLVAPNQPTSTQLAARRSLPRDLPSFSGDPNEWPLFISTFENSTAVAGFSNAENLVRLQSCLKGQAREVVRNKLLLPSMVPDIIRILQMRFGRPELILHHLMEKVNKIPPIKDRLDAIIDLAFAVQNLCATMEACNMHAYLNNPLLVKELVEKLPNVYKIQWAMHPKKDGLTSLSNFNEWLFTMAEAANDVSYPEPERKKSGSVHVHSTSSKQASPCLLCEHPHKLSQCEQFRELSVDERWNLVKNKNLCNRCLGSHRKKCVLNKECGLEGCKYKHSRLLHNDTKTSKASHGVSTGNSNPSPPADTSTSQAAKNIAKTNGVMAHYNADNKQPYFRIIPVRVHARNAVYNTFAFLDEGSSVSLIDAAFFNELGLHGKKDPLRMHWTGDTTRDEEESVQADIRISGLFDDVRHTLKTVHTVMDLGLPTQTLQVEELINKFPQLKGLPIASYKDAQPKILIGLDNWRLAVPLKVYEGKNNEPMATKTRLGWAIQGGESRAYTEGYLNIHACDCKKKYEELHDAVRNHFSLESSPNTVMVSAEDKMAVDILKSSCKKIGPHYEVGLLWRDPLAQLPESYRNAFQRYRCLSKRCRDDPSLTALIQKEIDNLVTKGYARKLSVEEAAQTSSKTWYLPIFITKNPNKPDRVRLVWDAAAKTANRSLNDFTLPGPDLLNSLLEILLAFRVGKIGICADIAEMFHRIRVNKTDMQAQRFLWSDPRECNEMPSTYMMEALTFGINCAPCIANYVRDTNANEFADTLPRATESIKHAHYMDDMIDSVNDDEEAFTLAQQVRDIHANASFHIRNWSSNARAVAARLNQHNEESRPKSLGDAEKVLGMYWDPDKDEFQFKFKFARLRRDIAQEDITPTKREVLQLLMSLFDPLGLLSHYTIGLKILLQDIWRIGIDWDEELPYDLYLRWRNWKAILPMIADTRVARCYSTIDINTAESVELHTFVDAGEKGYAAACYLRVKHGDEVTVTIIIAKSKVAPLKPVSIPRLELQAAVLGVRLAKTVMATRRLRIDSKFWWSDSKTVLAWLRMDPHKFQQFVMHRVGEILEYTKVTQWKWIPSADNPADLATKIQHTSAHRVETWFRGPKFLREEPDNWPKSGEIELTEQSELKAHVLMIKLCTRQDLPINYEYFSDWRRLYRATATFLLYLQRLKASADKAQRPPEITFTMLEQARILLVRQAQWEEYKEEISALTSNVNIPSNSPLVSCDAFLDADEVLRSRSRAEHLISEHVLILPRNHILTYLIIKNVHERLHHVTHETVIAHIRQRYYIIRLRALYKKVRRECQQCKNAAAVPRPPKMAPLPKARLASYERPFTYTGVDFFGPMYVMVGRRREKRWGVLFTCLTVRAVHLEVASSLNMDSCVMCIQSFMARRGTPRVIYSDNGTNFKAAKKIVCAETEMKSLTKKYDTIEWRFIPPAAPHMGGAWERLVRSVKTTLERICPTKTFTDESLRGALHEVEFIINSRPLTFVSLDSDDDEPLTPNHLLLGSATGHKTFCYEDGDLRQRWRQVEAFADAFWKRWVKEYLPVIARRGKWFGKQEPLRVGDVVLIIDEATPRNTWVKGRVIETITARDGQVRQVKVRTQQGVTLRPAAKIAVLDVGAKVG